MLQGFIDPAFEGVAAELRRLVHGEGLGGGALAIYHDGKCVMDVWYGHRDSNGNPWLEDTLALSFSTTKGITSTLLHLLADQGLIHYERPVSHYWPAFAQNGKSGIKVRHLLSHEAGLYNIRKLVDRAERMLDWQYMVKSLEKASPLHAPGKMHGYHGLTFGWLLGELIQKVTQRSFSEVLKTELCDRLGLDGAYIGLPRDQFTRRAYLASFSPEKLPNASVLATGTRKMRELYEGLQYQLYRFTSIDFGDVWRGQAPRGIANFNMNDEAVVAACIPAANGMFTARSLARVYALIANDGELDGVRLLRKHRVRQIAQVQSRTFDKVVPLPLHWRLGYHRVFTTGPKAPNAFGHFGFGGSGAWCDPSRRLALGFIVNSSKGSTPFGDARIVRLSTKAIQIADRVAGQTEKKSAMYFLSS